MRPGEAHSRANLMNKDGSPAIKRDSACPPMPQGLARPPAPGACLRLPAGVAVSSWPQCEALKMLNVPPRPGGSRQEKCEVKTSQRWSVKLHST